jgi:hypothetical protein
VSRGWFVAAAITLAACASRAPDPLPPTAPLDVPPPVREAEPPAAAAPSPPPAPIAPTASPLPPAPSAAGRGRADAKTVASLDDLFSGDGPHGTIKGKASPAQIAPYQACTADAQCVLVTNGCCPSGPYFDQVAVHRDKARLFQKDFDCRGVVCPLQARAPACVPVAQPEPVPGCDAERDQHDPRCVQLLRNARCKPVPPPVARCVDGRCTATAAAEAG